MKELNRMLSRYLERVKRTHRYLAILVVLSLVVTFIVPLGFVENADSKTGQLICGMVEHTHNAECGYGANCTITPHIHTEDCYRRVTLISAAKDATDVLLQTNAAGEDGNIVKDVTYSPQQVGLLTLLFGKKKNGEPLDWLKNVTTLDAALRAAEDEYFLGMASDFCAFIEGDFVPTDADAEGRVAVGGNLMFRQSGSTIWNYQIASGDYQSMTPIESTGPYQGVTGFASALAGGKLYRINTLSSGNKSQVTGAITAGAHTSGSTLYYPPENGGFKSFLIGNVNASRHWDGDKLFDISYSTSCHHDYPSDCPICADDMSKHAYLGTVNELAQMYQYIPTAEYTELRQVITEVFSEVRNRSNALSQMNSIPGEVSGGTVNFKYTGSKDVETVYFELDTWFDGLSAVNFSNIPTKKNADGKEVPVNIIVNCGGQTVNLRAGDGNFATNINGVSIHKVGNGGQNNHEWSSCVLYNFYDATKMSLNGNFNGTILAPNADVESDDTCSGHLSGALISKSFKGGIEFGYRPYRGGSDILGLVSEYAVPVDKFNGGGEYLSGAQLKVEQSLDNGSTFKTFMEHITGGKTWWIPFRSMIDYTGETKYLPDIEGADTMTVGDIQQLTVSNGLGTINLQGGSWSSSDTNIATVENGTVTAKTEGTVTITLTVNNKHFTKHITVVPVTITGDATMVVGSNQTLKINSDHSYTWVSSDESIATVDANGNVFAVAGGTVTISCRAGDTEVASFGIRVYAPLTLSDSLVSELYEGESIDLSDKVSGGSGNSSNYSWSITAGGNAAAVDGTTFTTKDISADTMVTLCVKDTVTNETKEKQITVKPLAMTPANSYTMVIKTSQTLNITVPEGMAYTVISDNESVATVTVNNGIVTVNAKAKGTAKIQLLLGGTSYASIELTVENEPIKISGTMPNAIYEGESIDLTGMASGGSGSFTWTVDSTDVATVIDNKLYANKNVDYNRDVNLTVTDTDGKTATHAVKIMALQITTNGEMSLGESRELKLNSDKQADYTWISSSDAITISGTTATANRAESNITISATKDGVTFATLTVAVSAPPFTFDTNGLPGEVYEGETISLVDRVTGGSGSYIWTFSGAVVSVDANGIITGNVEDGQWGGSSVTVTDKADPSKSASYWFNVKPVTIATSANTIVVGTDEDTAELTITKGDGHTLTASDNGAYATLNGTTVTAKAAGQVTYSLTMNGVTYASVTITVKKPLLALGKGDTQEITFDTNRIPKSIDLDAYRTGANNGWCQFSISVQDSDNNVQKKESTVENGIVSITFDESSTSKVKMEITCASYAQGGFVVCSYTIHYTNGTSETYPQAQGASIAARAKGIHKVSAIKAAGETMTQTFTQQYRITEVQPPEGYINDDTVYIVKVSETIDLTQIATELKDGYHYPMSTITQMEFYREVQEGENVSLALLDTVALVITDVYRDNLTNTRTIQIGSNTFTMEINAKTETVTELSINGSRQDDISLTEPSIITVGSSKFYLDPEHMMVMPAPAADQNATVRFTNRAGVLFKKVDDVNEPVTKATIEMSQLVDGQWQRIEDTTIFDAEAVKEDALTMMKLDAYLAAAGAYIFRFEETKTPNGYQTAAPVYFKIEVTDDLTATYYISSDNEVWEPLQPRGGENGYYAIPMVDKPLYGIKLVLKKVDGDDQTIVLNGAKFALYAADNTLIYPLDNTNWITTGEDGTVDLSALFSEYPDRTNHLYVTEDFLVEGSYYLKEMESPTYTDAEGNEKQYALPAETFAFHVKRESNGNYKLEITVPVAAHGFTTSADNNQAILITNEGLSQITDEMIKNNETVLTIVYTTPGGDNGEIGWGNAKYSGLYEDASKVSDKVNINNTTETVELKVKDMLTSLKINTDGLEGDALVAAFRKLQQFQFEVWNRTQIDAYTFLGETNIKPYNVTDIGWSIQGDGKPTVTISELTLYYKNVTSATINDVQCSSFKEWWSPLDLGTLPLEDVVGAKLVTGGNGSNNIQFKISADTAIWGNGKYGNIEIFPNQTRLFGDTSGTDYTESNTPSDAPLQVFDNSMIQIANDELGDNMDFRVEKHWVGDSDFLNMRPSEITVELWRSTNPDGTDGELVNSDGITNSVTLTSADNWTYLWENLPRQSEAGELYYYYAKEIADSISDHYTSSTESKPSNVGGIYVITNTLKTAHLSIEKLWEAPGYENVDLPDVLRLQLQWNIGGNWEDVPGKVLVLRKPANAWAEWTGHFLDLPVGYEYRVREVNLPFGWTMRSDVNSSADIEESDTNYEIALKNKFEVEQSSLAVKKDWDDESASERPDEIILNLYQSVVAPNNQYSDMPYGDDPESIQNDYARLLQYSLYFYDANMCGENAQQNSAVSWRGNCHIEDEVQGGFHDAGDHVMFGLTQGYAASTIGWGYYEFKDVYEQLGQSKHYEIIMKQFCDFFMNATELNADGTVKRMLYQKGSGGIDHAYWGAPENQDDRSDQMYWVTKGASDVAAEYAAALALQYLNFPDDPQRDNYLKYAKALFDFSVRDNATVGDQHQGFYNSDSCNDDQAWAAGWLCLADSANKDHYNQWLNNAGNAWCHSWNNVNVGAAYLQGKVNGDWNKMKDYLNCTNNNSYYYADPWGTARYNAAGQLAALTTAHALKETDSDLANKYAAWAHGQMDMLLGDNTWNDGKSVCLVTGFAPNSAKWAHHRAASGYDSDAEFEVNSTYDEDGHVLIGGLVGGPAFKAHDDQTAQLAGYPELMAYHEYLDHVQDYCCNEVSIDYNAGLVGAAAGLYAFYKTGELATEIEGVETIYLPEGYNGNPKPTTTATTAPEQPTTTTTTVANIDYTAPGGYYLAAYASQQIPPKGNSIELTGEALNIAGTLIDQIVCEFTGGGSFNGGIFCNGEQIGQYDGQGTKTLEFDPAKTVESLKLDSWWREQEVKLNVYFLVKITEPTIVGVPKALDINGTAKLSAAGFAGDDNIQWSSSNDAVISVDNGNVTTKDYGKVTITATRGAESATAIIAVKPPLSIDRTVLRSGDTDETRTTAQFTSAEGVTYIIEPEGIVTIGADGVITPVDGKTGTVTIQATKNGAESDAVQITVLAPQAADMVTIGTNSRQDMDEMLASLHGQATWSVKSGESYTVTPNVSGTMITVTDSNGDTILTLSTRTGLVRTFDVERKVTLTVSDAADGAVGDVIVNVKKTPYIAEIPEQRTNLIGKIHLTANGATLDVIKPSGDAAGVITDSIKLGETGKWSAVLNNLCRYDEMGNSYYYYIEEDVPNGSFSTNSTQYMVSGYTNNGTMLNAAGDTAASVSVTNARTGKVQHPLPSSGGEGKTNIYVVEVLLMLLGGAGFIGLKRRQGSSR